MGTVCGTQSDDTNIRMVQRPPDEYDEKEERR